MTNNTNNSLINWQDWMPKSVASWEAPCPVLLSGMPYELKPLVEDIVRRLPAKVVELKLNGAKFTKPEDERIKSVIKKRLDGGEEYTKRDPEDGEPETPPEFETFREQITDDDRYIIVPNFNPPNSPEQSRRLLLQLQSIDMPTFILCVEPSQRKPLAGPRLWAESAGRILSVKNGVLKDLQSGAQINFRRGPNGIVGETCPNPQSCTEAIRQILVSGPVSYLKVKKAVLDLGFKEGTFHNAMWRLAELGALEKVEYLAWKGDGLEGVDSLPSSVFEGTGPS